MKGKHSLKNKVWKDSIAKKINYESNLGKHIWKVDIKILFWVWILQSILFIELKYYNFEILSNHNKKY